MPRTPAAPFATPVGAAFAISFATFVSRGKSAHRIGGLCAGARRCKFGPGSLFAIKVRRVMLSRIVPDGRAGQAATVGFFWLYATGLAGRDRPPEGNAPPLAMFSPCRLSWSRSERRSSSTVWIVRKIGDFQRATVRRPKRRPGAGRFELPLATKRREISPPACVAARRLRVAPAVARRRRLHSLARFLSDHAASSSSKPSGIQPPICRKAGVIAAFCHLLFALGQLDANVDDLSVAFLRTADVVGCFVRWMKSCSFMHFGIGNGCARPPGHQERPCCRASNNSWRASLASPTPDRASAAASWRQASGPNSRIVQRRPYSRSVFRSLTV